MAQKTYPNSFDPQRTWRPTTPWSPPAWARPWSRWSIWSWS